MRQAIILNGPIGVGKTALGRALAERLGGAFIDSDDLRDPARRWFDEVLSGTKALARAGIEALAHHPVLVVAKPLRARDWALLRALFHDAGVTAFCVTLAADREAILDPSRGRRFSAGERERIAEMIAQGYGARPFSDLIIRTDRRSFADTLEELVAGCRGLPERPAAGRWRGAAPP